jgi:hypothetical protein
MAGNQNFSNKVARRVARNTMFGDIINMIGASSTWNQGDLLIFNTTTLTVARAAVQSDGANFLGISPVTIVNGKMASSYTADTDASQTPASMPGPEFGDEYFVVCKAGDALTPGCALYLAPLTGYNTVSVTGNKQVGIYIGPAMVSATGGSTIVAKLLAAYPDGTLKG